MGTPALWGPETFGVSPLSTPNVAVAPASARAGRSSAGLLWREESC